MISVLSIERLLVLGCTLNLLTTNLLYITHRRIKEPLYNIYKALVAQWLEQGSHKPLAAGSSPARRTNYNIMIEFDITLLTVAVSVLITLLP